MQQLQVSRTNRLDRAETVQRKYTWRLKRKVTIQGSRSQSQGETTHSFLSKGYSTRKLEKHKNDQFLIA